MTTEKEPGWVEENQLADRLGWMCVKDESRSHDPLHPWCRFKKDDDAVWCAYPYWIRATLVEGHYRNHRKHTVLEQALRGETNE